MYGAYLSPKAVSSSFSFSSSSSKNQAKIENDDEDENEDEGKITLSKRHSPLRSGKADAEVLRAQVGLDDVGITKATTRAKLVCDNRRPLNQQ